MLKIFWNNIMIMIIGKRKSRFFTRIFIFVRVSFYKNSIPFYAAYLFSRLNRNKNKRQARTTWTAACNVICLSEVILSVTVSRDRLIARLLNAMLAKGGLSKWYLQNRIVFMVSCYMFSLTLLYWIPSPTHWIICVFFVWL